MPGGVAGAQSIMIAPYADRLLRVVTPVDAVVATSGDVGRGRG